MQQETEQTKKAKSRIIMINDDIRNNLSALSMEGNFTQEVVQFYIESQGRMLQYQEDNKRLQLALQDLKRDTAAELTTMAGQIQLKVRKADVVSQLNVETTGIYFRTKRFLVDTPNFKVTKNSCYVNGTIYASSGKIGGWTISGNNLIGFYDSSSSNSSISGGTIEANAASADYVQFSDIDFNPQYATTVHTIDLTNAYFTATVDDQFDEDTQFSDITSHGPVECDNLTCATLHCTGLQARSDTEYLTVYCEEIVTDSETWSDRRVKKDISPVSEEEAAAVTRLRPVSFRYIRDQKPGVGLIAQELKEVADQYGFDGCVGKAKGYYGIAYRQLIPLMIKQIQINMQKLEELKHGKDDRL